MDTLFFLVYEEQFDNSETLWVARSVGTGHVAIGRSKEQALDCLCKTVRGSLHLAAKSGASPAEWLASQGPDEPRFMEMFFEVAQRDGCETIRLEGARVSVAQRAA